MKVYFDEKINDYVYDISNIVKIRSVKPLEGYKLLIGFSTGEKKVYDVSPLLEKPLFSPLKNIALFNKAHIECGTVLWNDDIDLCPENLYIDSVPFSDPDTGRHV